MPLDTTTEVQSVERLVDALRSPVPAGFEWDFRQGATCALGLGVRIGLSLPAIRKELGIGVLAFAAQEIGGVVPLYGVPARSVTPAMVADALEQLAIEREG